MSDIQGTVSSNSMLEPLDNVNGFDVRPGNYNLPGATVVPYGVNFTIMSFGATSCVLLLFRRDREEPYAEIPFPDHYRIGRVYSMVVYGLDITEFEYAYKLDGEYNPVKGKLFNKNNIVLDPYAKAVTGQSVWGKLKKEGTFYKARVVNSAFDWGSDRNPVIPMTDLVIYELHVRGFTKDKSSCVEAPGTFKGLSEKIEYLKELGINAVELMPIFEFDEMRDRRDVDGSTVINYWGYNTISFFAPNTSYTYEVEYNHEGTELKQLIRELNRSGIEAILDVVFNHTAEGDDRGPCISFKGLDNNIYYMLTPDGHYYNFSGCGNTLNCNHPVVQNMILDCLRYWVTEYHVDGFRFDLASILGRDEDGSPLSQPPILKAMAMDPVLADTKLIAEAWDAGGMYQVGNFPSWGRWAEWNGKYRDTLRDFLKGGLDKAYEAGQRITGSKDLYNPLVRGNASVNFLNCHDGFTLWDMYSYNNKHNESNGWNNTDGSNDNRSWNCGFEGETDSPEVNRLRQKMCMNAMTVLLMSRGTPMFLAGDEFLNTQFGNNNAYCQDNITSWLDWSRLETEAGKAQFDLAKKLIELRKEHVVIRRPNGISTLGFPDESVSICCDGKVLQVMYAGRTSDDSKDDLVIILINVFWEQMTAPVMNLPMGLSWDVKVDTSKENPMETVEFDGGSSITIAPRSVIVMITH